MEKNNHSPGFSTVFFTVVSLTLTFVIGLFFLSTREYLTTSETKLFELLSMFAQTGFGTIIGLISAKNLK